MTILYQTAKNSPILIASNREERLDRPTQVPKIQSGSPRVVCGIDQQAGGTWLGVNQHGMFAAVCNRKKRNVPMNPRSRGLLCRELLENPNAKEATEHALRELSSGAYAGANYIVGDADSAAVVYGGDEIKAIPLTPGLHTIGNGNMDDTNDPRQEFASRMLTLHTLDSQVTFLAVASRAFSRAADAQGRRGLVLTQGQYGTVSSTLLALNDKIQQSVFQYAPGPPSENSYDDLSALLRQVLSTDRSKKQLLDEDESEGEPDDVDDYADYVAEP